MAYCSNCGKKIDEHADICLKCGKFVGNNQSNNNSVIIKKNKSVGPIGIVIIVLFSVLYLFFVFLFLVVLFEDLEYNYDDIQYKDEYKFGHVGDTLYYNDLAITLNKVNFYDELVVNDGVKYPNDGNEYLVAIFEIKNYSGSYDNMYNFECYKYGEYYRRLFLDGNDGFEIISGMEDGIYYIEMKVVFEIEKDIDDFNIRYNNNINASDGGVIFNIDRIYKEKKYEMNF